CIPFFLVCDRCSNFEVRLEPTAAHELPRPADLAAHIHSTYKSSSGHHPILTIRGT
ncbi:hypothetical protein BC629DRAFT_1512789, partial [Irpex lacteus]